MSHMHSCSTAPRPANRWIAELELGFQRMAKRYQIVRDRMPNRDGGFIEAFRLALIEFSCLGERRFDISGYPYGSQEDAFGDDWQALAGDARAAIKHVGKIAIKSEGPDNGEGQQASKSATE